MTTASGSHGADTPHGPGWWEASDGRFYPPELAPGARARRGEPPAEERPQTARGDEPATPPTSSSDGASGSGKKAVKKKALKKKAVKKRAVKKKAVKKKAESVAAGPRDPDDRTDHHPDHHPDDEVLADRRAGRMKYTAQAPANDQIAARRIQAKEQIVLMADDRQAAALRAVADAAVADEPLLVSVGGASLEARADPASPAPSEDPSRVAGSDEPESAEPHPSGDPSRVAGGSLPVAPSAPAPPSRSEGPPPTTPEHLGAEAVTTPTGDLTAAGPPSAPPAGAPTGGQPGGPPATGHQPLVSPEPGATPMGTDVPFMEVKGSALATDIDRIGEKILIFADRVELRDRSNSVRQVIRYDQLIGVTVQKKIMGPTLLVSSSAAATMSVKALRPELASGAKAMIEKHAERYRRGGRPAPRTSQPAASESEPAAQTPPEPAPTAPQEPAPVPAETTPTTELPETAPTAGPVGAPQPEPARDPEPEPEPTRIAVSSTHHSVLVGMLEELHAAGILTTEELESKKALIEMSDRGLS